MQHNDGLGLFDAVKQFFGTGFEPQDIIGQYVRVASRNYHVDACTTIKTVSVIDIFSQMKGLGTQWTLCFGIEPFVSYGAYELKTSVTENKVEHVEASITQYEFSTLLLSWPENIWTLWGVPFPVTNAMQVHDLLMIKYNDEFPASEKIRDAAKKNLPFKILNKKGINLTMGLNYRRLSPTHGTANDIIFKNLAETTSFTACMEY